MTNLKAQVHSSMMMKPKYDVSRIDKELLWFLEYTCSGHCSDDWIPLALVQAFGDVSWTDILIDQDKIHQICD